MLSVLGEAALRTALLTGVVQCGLWLLRVRQTQLLLTTWTIVLAASIAMPMLLRFDPLRLPINPALSMPLIDGAADLLQGTPLQTPPGNARAEARTQPSIESWLEAVYAVGALAVALRLAVGIALSLRLLSQAIPFCPDWAAGTRVRISRDIKGPVTIGLVILLPIDVVAWPTKTRQAVLAHERAHVARWDFPMLILSQLNRAVFWFSPLSWWLHRRLVALTELASDDQAMASTRDRLGYAEILLEMGRRPEPASPGLAMARPSTLHVRIDRILLDQAIPRRVSPPQQAALTAGVAGLSLMAVNLAPGLVAEPVMTVLPQKVLHSAGVVLSTSSDTAFAEPANSGSVTQQDSSREELSATPLPSTTARRPEPAPFTAAALPQLAAPAAATTRRPQAATRLILRSASQTPTNNTPSIPLVRGTKQITRVAPTQRKLEESSTSQEYRIDETASRKAGDPDVAPSTGSLVKGEVHSPLPHQVAPEPSSVPPRPAIEQVMGSTCIGTVAVGLRAQRTSFQQPDVVAGQVIPAQAIFFRKHDGTSWVRFSVFGRPPLDLPVGVSQSGMTWTGEYGISYGVQALGRDRLAGIAALIAHDSAKLEFACK